MGLEIWGDHNHQDVGLRQFYNVGFGKSCSNEAISGKKKSSSFCQMLEKPI